LTSWETLRKRGFGNFKTSKMAMKAPSNSRLTLLENEDIRNVTEKY
jgi:hypothetical protein